MHVFLVGQFSSRWRFIDPYFLIFNCIIWDHSTGLHVGVFIGRAFIQLAGTQITWSLSTAGDFCNVSSMHWTNREQVCYQLEISVPIYLSDHQVSFCVISLAQSTAGTYPKRQTKDLSNRYIEFKDQDPGYAHSSSSYLSAWVKERMNQKTNAHLHPYTKHNHRTKPGEALLI